MKDTEKMMVSTVIGILLMMLAVILSSCKSTQYIPVESVRTEYVDKVHRDSIHVFDSVYIREKGDTVWLTRWRTEYKDRLVRDSIIVRDSIHIPFPVERQLSRWEKTKMDMGGIAIGCSIACILLLVWKLVRRRA